MELYARVIDFMPEGRPTDRMREPIAQLVGEKFFTLLEVSIIRGSAVALGQRLCIGKEGRDSGSMQSEKASLFICQYQSGAFPTSKNLLAPVSSIAKSH